MKKKSLAILLACTLGVIGAYCLNNGQTTNANAATVETESTSLTEVTTGSAVKVGEKLTNPEKGWKRYDDTDEHIKYPKYGFECEGPYYYGDDEEPSTITIIEGENRSVGFSFTGTKLRLTGWLNKKGIEISLDGGKTFEKIEPVNKSGAQTLIYEKTGLSNEKHDVVLKMDEYLYFIENDIKYAFALNAIDIDEDGKLENGFTPVGERLDEPDEGWKRYDDKDKNIKYSGKNVRKTDKTMTEIYNSEEEEIPSISFSFTGNELRLVGGCLGFIKVVNVDPPYSEEEPYVQYWPCNGNGEISFDGGKTFEEFKVANTRNNYPGSYYLFYEKKGLSDGEHDVVLRVKNKIGSIYLNAVEINENGELGSFASAKEN